METPPERAPDVAARFSDLAHARAAIEALENSGVDGDDIELLGRTAEQAAAEPRQSDADRRAVSHVLWRVIRAGDLSNGRIELASAGHPPAMVQDPDGAVRVLEGGRSVPLCTLKNAVFHEVEAQLAPGSTLLLYTDGLIERRGESLDQGFERLASAIAGASVDLEAAIDDIAATMLRDGVLHDDVALLALRTRA
jgi:hypothetical protein